MVMLAAVSVLLVSAPAALADDSTSNSSSYKATELQFGSASNQQNCSASYCAKASIGDMNAGASSSATKTAAFGKIEGSEPMLEVIVEPGASNLGILTTEHTASKTMEVQVRNYLSSGYILQITGDPPKYAGHALATPTTPTAATPGTEQFALNAADNSTPDIGAAPVQVPDGTFSFGTVEPDYSTPNRFKYISGDTIASSGKSSGRTDYTISMIVNVSNSTPAGHYQGDFSAVVIPTY